MNNTPTVASYTAKPIIEGWIQSGCSEAALQAAMGEHYQNLASSRYRIPFETMKQAYQTAAIELNDPLIGVHTGFNFIHASLGPLSNLITTAEDIRSALTACLRFMDIMTQGYEFSCKEDHYGATVRMTVREGIEVSHYQFDFMLSLFIRYLTFFCGKPKFILYLQHNPIDSIKKQYARAIQADIFFNQAYNGIFIPQHILNTPISNITPDQFEQHIKSVQQIYEETDGARNIYQIVRGRIRHSSLFDTIGLEQIAEQLGLTPRTLQNKLKPYNTTFRTLVDDVRTEIATSLIRRGAEIAEVADKTGYRDLTTFNRAFKRWKGMSFQEYKMLSDKAGQADQFTIAREEEYSSLA